MQYFLIKFLFQKFNLFGGVNNYDSRIDCNFYNGLIVVEASSEYIFNIIYKLNKSKH